MMVALLSPSDAFSVNHQYGRRTTTSTNNLPSKQNANGPFGTMSPLQVVTTRRDINARNGSWTTDMKLHATNSNGDDSNHPIVDPIIVQKVYNTNDEDVMQPQQQRRGHHHGVHPLLIQLWKNLRRNGSESITQQQPPSTSSPSSYKNLRQKSMTILASAVIMFAVLFAPLQDAFAAPSGGRMGGSFGGSSRSRSPSSSRTYSSPSSGSYNRGFSRGYGAGYYSRPSVTIAPSIGGYGYYGAPVLAPVGPGAVVVRRGPSIVDIFLFMVFVGVAVNAFRSSSDTDDDYFNQSALGIGTTVAQISVALSVPRRNDPNSILSFLDRLSRTASTDSRVGVSNLVSQVSLELMRQKSNIFAANTEYKHFSSAQGAEKYYNKAALKERSKFDKEITNKYGGVDYGIGGSGSAVSFEAFPGQVNPQATSAVVTILIAIDGDETQFPTINNMRDLQKALTTMAADVKVDDCLRSAEVLWTPEDSADVLSERDIIVDYPELRRV